MLGIGGYQEVKNNVLSIIDILFNVNMGGTDSSKFNILFTKVESGNRYPFIIFDYLKIHFLN